jgi:hypothetical protein
MRHGASSAFPNSESAEDDDGDRSEGDDGDCSHDERLVEEPTGSFNESAESGWLCIRAHCQGQRRLGHGFEGGNGGY